MLLRHSKKTKTLLAIYDLYSYAPTFNVYEFLTGAKIFADSVRATNIDLLILKRNLTELCVWQPQSKSQYDHRINDILVGATPMFPIDNTNLCKRDASTEKLISEYENVFPPQYKVEINPSKKDNERYYLQPYLRDIFASQGFVPSIRIPVAAHDLVKKIKKKDNLVTITIRNANHLQTKNSNIEEWAKVGAFYKKNGFKVIIINDIENINEFENFDVFSVAAVSNQTYRAAIYDAAVLNMGVNNGSIAPLMFNANARMLLAKLHTEGTNTAATYFSNISGITEKNRCLDWGALASIYI